MSIWTCMCATCKEVLWCVLQCNMGLNHIVLVHSQISTNLHNWLQQTSSDLDSVGSCFVTASQAERLLVATSSPVSSWLKTRKRSCWTWKRDHLEEPGYTNFNGSNPCATRVSCLFFYRGGHDSDPFDSNLLTVSTFITKYSQTDLQPELMLLYTKNTCNNDV